MGVRRKKKSRKYAPSIVYYTRAQNEHGAIQSCVYGECTYGGTRYGPVWGHSMRSVRRCLIELTRQCDCGRPYHSKKYVEGTRVKEA